MDGTTVIPGPITEIPEGTTGIPGPITEALAGTARKGLRRPRDTPRAEGSHRRKDPAVRNPARKSNPPAARSLRVAATTSHRRAARSLPPVERRLRAEKHLRPVGRSPRRARPPTARPRPRARPRRLVRPRPRARLRRLVRPRPRARLRRLARPRPRARLRRLARPRPRARLRRLVRPRPRARLRRPGGRPRPRARLRRLVRPRPRARLRRLVRPPPTARRLRRLARPRPRARARRPAKLPPAASRVKFSPSPKRARKCQAVGAPAFPPVALPGPPRRPQQGACRSPAATSPCFWSSQPDSWASALVYGGWPRTEAEQASSPRELTTYRGATLLQREGRGSSGFRGGSLNHVPASSTPATGSATSTARSPSTRSSASRRCAGCRSATRRSTSSWACPTRTRARADLQPRRRLLRPRHGLQPHRPRRRRPRRHALGARRRRDRAREAALPSRRPHRGPPDRLRPRPGRLPGRVDSRSRRVQASKRRADQVGVAVTHRAQATLEPWDSAPRPSTWAAPALLRRGPPARPRPAAQLRVRRAALRGRGRGRRRLDVSHTTSGWSLRLRFEAALDGPCMRCLEPAGHAVAVDAREIDQPGGGEELDSPYVDGDELDLSGWARDALALALPAQIVCARGVPRPLRGLRREPQRGDPGTPTSPSPTRAGRSSAS